ncbi:hypothetical protein AWW66_05915 [Micromonospora rosaria]|uniref:Glycosyl transferase n=1 Tax=Micromonospora rosaria TaxID=47874 RepID=A0A136PWK3_9ACTN|nr:glycosyltransferase family 2 protein [Micromonospora rosaria]KXK62868.1 hypothetical protein AWW66_05915 [Micromonospora rosaria]
MSRPVAPPDPPARGTLLSAGLVVPLSGLVVLLAWLTEQHVDAVAAFDGTAVRWARVGAGGATAVLELLLGLVLLLGIGRLVAQSIGAHVHARRRWQPRGPRPVIDAPVSVIVPAYNEVATIGATVRSLVASAYPAVEVIVVDDGSTDGTAELVARMRLRGVRVVRQAHAGRPAALDTGVRAARTELLVLVEGDTVVEADTVLRLVQRFADPTVGAVCGNTRVADRRRLLGRWQHLEYALGRNLDRRMYDVLGCLPTVPGALGAYRRQVLVAVGGVPVDTPAEATDLTMTVLRAGWRVEYEPDAIAWTPVPATPGGLWRQRYRHSHGILRAIWKHRYAVRESGPGGRLGRRALPSLLLCRFLLPLAAPVVDVLALSALLHRPGVGYLLAWVGLLLAQTLTAGYALWLDGERLRPLWHLPAQQLVYRYLMCLVVVRSLAAALTVRKGPLLTHSV